MDKIFSVIGMPKIWSFICCTFLAAVTPTEHFIVAIILACFFNVWCGMRADGVINIRCKSFSWKKFVYAIAELMMFIIVIGVVAGTCHLMGDEEVKIYACKAVAYCIVYCYLDNGLKNLCKSYPKSRGLWLIYLFVHLDFRRLIHLDDLMARYEEHVNKQDDGTNK